MLHAMDPEGDQMSRDEACSVVNDASDSLVMHPANFQAEEKMP